MFMSLVYYGLGRIGIKEDPQQDMSGSGGVMVLDDTQAGARIVIEPYASNSGYEPKQGDILLHAEGYGLSTRITDRVGDHELLRDAHCVAGGYYDSFKLVPTANPGVFIVPENAGRGSATLYIKHKTMPYKKFAIMIYSVPAFDSRDCNYVNIRENISGLEGANILLDKGVCPMQEIHWTPGDVKPYVYNPLNKVVESTCPENASDNYLSLNIFNRDYNEVLQDCPKFTGVDYGVYQLEHLRDKKMNLVFFVGANGSRFELRGQYASHWCLIQQTGIQPWTQLRATVNDPAPCYLDIYSNNVLVKTVIIREAFGENYKLPL